MTRSGAETGAIIRELIEVLRREAHAVVVRDLAALSKMTDRKERLANRLAGALENAGGANNEGLLHDLDTLQTLAASNAAQIRVLRDGAARARARIESLAAGARQVGVYGAQGRLLNLRGANAASRNV